MAKLLKEKCVFVGTQTFREARFAVSNLHFAKLREHGEGRKLTFPDITREQAQAVLEYANRSMLAEVA